MSRNSAGVKCARRRQRRVNPFYVFRITYSTLWTHIICERQGNTFGAFYRHFLHMTCKEIKKYKSFELRNGFLLFHNGIQKLLIDIEQPAYSHLHTHAHKPISISSRLLDTYTIVCISHRHFIRLFYASLIQREKIHLTLYDYDTVDYFSIWNLFCAFCFYGFNSIYSLWLCCSFICRSFCDFNWHEVDFNEWQPWRLYHFVIQSKPLI